MFDSTIFNFNKTAGRFAAALGNRLTFATALPKITSIRTKTQILPTMYGNTRCCGNNNFDNFVFSEIFVSVDDAVNNDKNNDSHMWYIMNIINDDSSTQIHNTCYPNSFLTS